MCLGVLRGEHSLKVARSARIPPRGYEGQQETGPARIAGGGIACCGEADTEQGAGRGEASHLEATGADIAGLAPPPPRGSTWHGKCCRQHASSPTPAPHDGVGVGTNGQRPRGRPAPRSRTRAALTAASGVAPPLPPPSKHGLEVSCGEAATQIVHAYQQGAVRRPQEL